MPFGIFFATAFDVHYGNQDPSGCRDAFYARAFKVLRIVIQMLFEDNAKSCSSRPFGLPDSRNARDASRSHGSAAV